MINFPKDLTTDSCEAFVNGLDEASPSEALYLPSEFNNALFGGVAAAIQAINTWGRLSSSREIVLGGNSEETQEYTDEVVNRPHKFNAAMLAKKIILSSTGGDIRKAVNIAARGAIESQAEKNMANKEVHYVGFLLLIIARKVSTRTFIRNLLNMVPFPGRSLR